jgi:hypothetical protein
MLVIYRTGQWELIKAPQNIAAAWRLADKLSRSTGVSHFVGRA